MNDVWMGNDSASRELVWTIEDMKRWERSGSDSSFLI